MARSLFDPLLLTRSYNPFVDSLGAGDFPFVGIYFVTSPGRLSSSIRNVPISRVFDHQGKIHRMYTRLWLITSH